MSISSTTAFGLGDNVTDTIRHLFTATLTRGYLPDYIRGLHSGCSMRYRLPSSEARLDDPGRGIAKPATKELHSFVHPYMRCWTWTSFCRPLRAMMAFTG